MYVCIYRHGNSSCLEIKVFDLTFEKKRKIIIINSNVQSLVRKAKTQNADNHDNSSYSIDNNKLYESMCTFNSKMNPFLF